MTEEQDQQPAKQDQQQPAPGRQIAYLQRLLQEITDGGRDALIEQFCVWANTYIELCNADEETARQVRAEQAFPVALILCEATGMEVEDVMDAMHDAVVRALFQAKLEDRHELSFKDAEKALTDAVKILRVRAQAH